MNSAPLALPSPRSISRPRAVGALLGALVVPQAVCLALVATVGHQSWRVAGAEWGAAAGALLAAAAWRRWPVNATAALLVVVAAGLGAGALHAVAVYTEREPYHVAWLAGLSLGWTLVTVLAALWAFLARVVTRPTRWGFGLGTALSLFSVFGATFMTLELGWRPPATPPPFLWRVRWDGDRAPQRRLWELVPAPGMVGAVELKSSDDGRIVSVRQTRPASLTGEVRLRRGGLRLAAGERLRIELQARAPVAADPKADSSARTAAPPPARQLDCQLTTPGKRPTWSQSQGAELTTDWQAFAFEFVAESDLPELVLALQVGGPVGTIELADLFCQRVQPSVEGESTRGAWHLRLAPGARARCLSDPAAPGQLRVAIDQAAADDPSAVRLVREGLPLDPGLRYRWQWRARADAPRTLEYAFRDAAGGGPPLAWGRAELTPEWHWWATVVAPPEGLRAGDLEFHLAGGSAPVELADLALVPCRRETPSQVLPEFWRLTTSAYARAAWRPTVEPAGAVSVAIDHAAVPDLDSVRLSQPGLELTAATRYRLRLLARADEARSLEVRLQTEAMAAEETATTAERATAEPTALVEGQIELTTEDQEHLWDFTPSTSGLYELSLAVGGKLGQVELTAVDLVAAPEPPPGELTAADQPPPPWQLVRGPQVAAELDSSVEGENSARVTLQGTASTEPWQVQLARPAPRLVGGTRYRLRLSGRAEPTRTMRALLVGPDPAEPLGLDAGLDLGPAWSQRQTHFIARRDQEDSRLVFFLGGDPGDLELAEVELAAAPRESPTELAPEDWLLNARPECQARLVNRLPEGEPLRVELEGLRAVDPQPFDATLQQPGLGLDAGARYALAFRARASASRPVTCAVLSAQRGEFLGLIEDVALSPRWREFRREFVAQRTAANAAVVFNLAQASGWLEFEGLALERLADPVSTASAGGDIPLDEAEGWALGIVPGTRWHLSLPAGAAFSARAATPANQPDVLRVDLVDGEKSQPPQVRLVLTGLRVRLGQVYQLSFRARAEEPRLMRYGLRENSSPFAELGLAGALPTTTRWQTVVRSFVAAADCDDAQFTFDLGGHRAAIELTDFVWRRPDQRAANVPLLVSCVAAIVLSGWAALGVHRPGRRRPAPPAPTETDPAALPPPRHAKEIRYLPEGDPPRAAP